MFVKCLVTLFFATGLASSTSHAATPSGNTRIEAPAPLFQGVVLGRSSDASHAKAAPQTGLIMVGNPPSKLTIGPSIGNNLGNPMKYHKGAPKTGLIMVGNPPSKLTSGLIMVGNPPSKLWGRAKSGAGTSAKARTVTWTAHDGSSLTLAFESPTDLADIDALVAPAGEWTDLSIALDGPLFIDGDIDGVPYGLTLDIETWSMPLEMPVVSDGDTQIVIDAELPELLVEAVLEEDGLVLEPGDRLHDEVMRALQDSTLARAR